MSWGGVQDERVPPGNEYCADIPCAPDFGCSLLFIDSSDFGALMSKRSARSEGGIGFSGLAPKIKMSSPNGPCHPVVVNDD